jgi:hypothetical protein
MSSVFVQVVSKDQLFPAGTVSGKLRISLIGGPPTPIPVQDVDGLSATFLNVPAGEYIAHAQRLDAAGVALGADAISAAFTVGGTGEVTVQVPDTVTATVTA